MNDYVPKPLPDAHTVCQCLARGVRTQPRDWVKRDAHYAAMDKWFAENYDLVNGYLIPHEILPVNEQDLIESPTVAESPKQIIKPAINPGIKEDEL